MVNSGVKTSKVISTIFPKYYTDLQPKIIEIQKGLSKVRNKKHVDNSGTLESFDIYEKNKIELLEIYKTIQKYVPLLEKEKKTNLFSFIRNHIITIIISIVVGLLVGIILSKRGWM